MNPAKEPRTNCYTGEVVSGGPADVRETGPLTIRKVSVSGMHNNVYLLTCTATGEQLLIDAADDAPLLLHLVRGAGNGSLATVVTTHQHWDHVRALAEVLDATGARSVAGAQDADALPARVDERVVQADSVTVGKVTLDVVHLRGHTPGGIALAWRDPSGMTHLFTGDSLFPGGVGNTKNEGQSFASLYSDVTERIFEVYDDNTWVYPGHGGDTTLGAERPHLAEWRERGW